MLDAAQKEIDAFYGRYADKEQITLAEAKRRVSKLDIAAYQRKAKRYVADKDFGKQANEEMRLYNLTMKVNRLEMLKANIGLELVAGHDEQEQFMSKILRGRTEEELQRQAGPEQRQAGGDHPQCVLPQRHLFRAHLGQPDSAEGRAVQATAGGNDPG